jgi:hypothetical protein
LTHILFYVSVLDLPLLCLPPTHFCSWSFFPVSIGIILLVYKSISSVSVLTQLFQWEGHLTRDKKREENHIFCCRMIRVLPPTNRVHRFCLNFLGFEAKRFSLSFSPFRTKTKMRGAPRVRWFRTKRNAFRSLFHRLERTRKWEAHPAY